MASADLDPGILTRENRLLSCIELAWRTLGRTVREFGRERHALANRTHNELRWEGSL
jgi:hypothetical protein